MCAASTAQETEAARLSFVERVVEVGRCEGRPVWESFWPLAILALGGRDELRDTPRTLGARKRLRWAMELG